MAQVSVFDMNGNAVSTLELNDTVFGIEPNMDVMHTAVVNFLANQRHGTQSTLTRTEVRGGGRKPWRQKGTGHARQGSIRSPQWRHGGIALGPKPRTYNFTINKKVRRLALKSALSSKLIDSELIVLDSVNLTEYKTKVMIKMFDALNVNRKALLVLGSVDDFVVKSTANIPGIKTTQFNTLNVYDILNYDKLIILKDAVAKIEEVFV